MTEPAGVEPARSELLASLERHHEECNQDDGPGCDTRRALDLLAAEADYASSLRADLDRAEAALKAVRELHIPHDYGDCVTCSHEIGPGAPPGVRYDCAHSDHIVEWPCPTVTAINDAFTVVSPPHVREWLRSTADEGEAGDG